ncbi:MAG: hypothetical protein HC780_18700 [Leptolyngbyaceae cyanobacterium CSU_1_3]|nr:hypothetical protein [Leptolyngbyaceae cyanobacterium CSU_1_3]
MTHDQNASRRIHVNGRMIAQDQKFPKSGNWNEIEISNVWLKAGENSVSVILNPSAITVDSLKLDELSIH